MVVCCEDCDKPYTEFGLDLVLPDSQWEEITGRSDGSVILCANCIVKRAAKLSKFTVVKAQLE